MGVGAGRFGETVKAGGLSRVALPVGVCLVGRFSPFAVCPTSWRAGGGREKEKGTPSSDILLLLLLPSHFPTLLFSRMHHGARGLDHSQSHLLVSSRCMIVSCLLASCPPPPFFFCLFLPSLFPHIDQGRILQLEMQMQLDRPCRSRFTLLGRPASQADLSSLCCWPRGCSSRPAASSCVLRVVCFDRTDPTLCSWLSPIPLPR